MSRKIALVLGKSEAAIAKDLAKLEAKAGYPSQDVRFMALHSHEARQKVAALGLDPDDTTGPELYHSLLARFESDSAHIDKAMGISPQASQSERLAKAIQLAAYITGSPETWAMKNATVKNLLQSVTPKKTIKALGYRTVDSMLKRRSPSDVFLLADQLESVTWHKALAAKCAHLGSTDYELRCVRVTELPLAAQKELSVQNAQVGTVGINMRRIRKDASVLGLALILSGSIASITNRHDKLAVSKINPLLAWWEGAEHLLTWHDRQPVSLNLVDVASSHLSSSAYHQGMFFQAGQQLWSKLVQSYKQHTRDIPSDLAELESDAVNNINKMLVPNEELAMEYAES